MALDPDLVAFAANLIYEEPLDNAQLSELGHLLENREELFAYLLTHSAFLQKNPDIQEELSRLSREHGHGAATKRETMGPPTVVHDLISQLQDEILARIAGEMDEKKRSKLDEVDRQITQYTSTSIHLETSPERWIKR
jgi:hypothetical protein